MYSDADGEDLRSIVNTALGKEKADLAILNGSLVNVYTGEIQPGIGVAVKGERIAYVGSEPDHTIGPRTEVVDARGKFLIPGFIDGHAHIDTVFTIAEFLRYAIPTGTTTIITETSSIGNALGYPGALQFVENAKDQPILVYALAPSQVPNSPPYESSSYFPPEQIGEMLSLPEVLGIGETFWPRILDLDPTMMRVVEHGLRARKVVQGHSAGAKGSKLAGFIGAGISSCHEPITVEETVERLRLGMHVMIREGSLRRDLEAIAPIKDMDIDLRRLSLVCDGLWPAELMCQGYLDYVVQKAIDLGFEPVTAIRMATLNVAEHFGLDLILGGIAPHRYANINIIPDIRTIKCECVISKGRVVAADGELLASPRPDRYPALMKRSVRLPRAFTADDFRIDAPDLDATDGTDKLVRVRAITIVRDMITGEKQADVLASGGVLAADLERDLLKVAVINRHNGVGEKFVGLAHGFGLSAGAYASTISWDTENVVLVGASEADMALAVNRVRELQGGVVLCIDGVIYEELPMPVGGIISELPLEEIGHRLGRMDTKLRQLGCSLPNPFLSLQTLTFTPLPYLRVTERGFFDVRQKRLIGLFVNQA